MTFIPMAWHLRATSLPLRPTPIPPSVFPANSAPLNLLFTHWWSFSVSYAWGKFLASAKSMAMVCSAVVVVEPPGEFITKTPCSVAALTSTLSTPTPARPMTLSLVAFWMTSRSITVALRTTRPSISEMLSRSFWREILSWTSAVIEPVCCISSIPAGSMPSSRRTLNEDIERNFGFRCGFRIWEPRRGQGRSLNPKSAIRNPKSSWEVCHKFIDSFNGSLNVGQRICKREPQIAFAVSAKRGPEQSGDTSIIQQSIGAFLAAHTQRADVRKQVERPQWLWTSDTGNPVQSVYKDIPASLEFPNDFIDGLPGVWRKRFECSTLVEGRR